jgi:hypothetical protein
MCRDAALSDKKVVVFGDNAGHSEAMEVEW